MFLHVCCERDTHPESLNGGAVRQFFAEDYYQIGTDKPVSLAGLEARLVEMAKDPRVLFGLCKMTVASPPLVVFDLGVEEQLEEVIRSHCSREVVSRHLRQSTIHIRMYTDTRDAKQPVAFIRVAISSAPGN